MQCYYCEYEFCWICGETFSKDHYSQMNPFGCSGAQFKNLAQANSCKKMFMLYLWRLLMLIGMILLGPFIMLFFLPVSLCYACIEKSKECIVDSVIRSVFLVVILPIVFIFGIVADIIVAPFAIVFGLPYFIIK